MVDHDGSHYQYHLNHLNRLNRSSRLNRLSRNNEIVTNTGLNQIHIENILRLLGFFEMNGFEMLKLVTFFPLV